MNGDGQHFGDLFLTLDAVQDGCEAAHSLHGSQPVNSEHVC